MMMFHSYVSLPEGAWGRWRVPHPSASLKRLARQRDTLLKSEFLDVLAMHL